MLNLKPRLDPREHPAELLRRKRCTVCRKPFIGHFASRQCSDPCRAEAVRARGRVSSQKIRDARWEPLPDISLLMVPQADGAETLDTKDMLGSMPEGALTVQPGAEALEAQAGRMTVC